MAKKFAGFTPEQMGKIIPEMQGMQADEQAAYLASQPGAAARVGKMAEVAQKRIGMAYGGMATKKGYAVGGSVPIQAGDATAMGTVLEAAENLIDGGQIAKMPTDSANSRLEFTDKYGDAIANLEQTQPTTMEGIYHRGQPGLPGTLRGDADAYNNMGNYVAIEGTKEQARPNNPLDLAREWVSTANTALQDAINAQQADPENEELVKAVTDAQTNVNNAKQKYSLAYSDYKTTQVPTSAELNVKAATDPGSMTKTADVATISEEDKTAGEIAAGTGDVAATTDMVVDTAETAADVTTPTKTDAVTYEPLSVESTTKDVLDRLEAATGKPSAEALVDAQSMSPDKLAQLGISAAQLSEARRVQPVDARTLQEGEMIEGSTVDMERVKKETNFEAATGAPSTDATVQGQLTGLMEQFEGSEPPAWAAGAMRAAAAQMAARGLSASSMAGQAAIQAAMESAMPIAVQDAQTSATFELTNLSNKQQSAMFAAEKRAEFLGLEFNQNFQARVANASKISEIANMNFTAEQQVALENARMAQSVDLANLSAANAKVMADAAAMTQLDLTNLNNRQQAQVQNAKSFLDMDMVNLSNEQQATMFKSQSMVNALLSDQAAENAAKQFNASSENQTNQFFTNLASQVSMFNNEQKNAMNQFNSGQTNAVNQFNVSQRAARDQFNANNQLIVAQANAAWSQAITTAETAAQNEANRDAAMAENQYTMTAYNNVIQEERDMISYAFSAAESTADRQVRLQVAAIQAETAASQIQAQIDTAAGAGSGKLLAAFADKALEWAFG